MIPHLTDDVLVRRVDGELFPEESDRVGRHLTECERCRDAVAEIESLSRRVARAVSLVDPPVSRPARNGAPPAPRIPPPRAGVSPLWRAAAVVALLVGLAFAIAPVRAWMAERLGLAPQRVEEAPPGGDDLAASRPTADGLRVAFRPDGDLFVVRVAVPQAAGRFTLAAAPGDTAAAEVSAADGDPAELLVLPDGLAIRNRSGSTADYQVVVPLGTSRVEVRVGDRVVWSGPPGLLEGSPVTLPLGDGSR